jgi:uncharacterized membrane protein YfcA
MSDAGAVAFAFDGATAAASIVCFVVAVLANAGGVGGGGVFVPLLMLVVGLGGKWVIPVSNAMILAGAIPAVAINLCKRHPCHNRPLLDVDIALLLVPATLGGTTPGVLLNVMFPEWLISALLVLLLSYTAHKTLAKGRSEWRKEMDAKRRAEMEARVGAESLAEEGAEAMEEGAASTSTKRAVDAGSSAETATVVVAVGDGKISRVSLDGAPSSSTASAPSSTASAPPSTASAPSSTASAPSSIASAPSPREPLDLGVVGGLVLLWAALFVAAYLRGGKSGAGSVSPVGIRTCVGWYWALVFLPPAVGVLASRAAGSHLRAKRARLLESGAAGGGGCDLRVDTSAEVWRYVAWAFGAGLGSGLLGIGGGMILGPLLLELGVDPRVSAPVTHFMVLFTSSATVIQFALIGQLLAGHAAWYSSLCLLASVVSAVGLVAALKKYGLGGSVIVLCLGFVIGLSAAMVAVELGISAADGGFDEGFSREALCGA